MPISALYLGYLSASSLCHLSLPPLCPIARLVHLSALSAHFWNTCACVFVLPTVEACAALQCPLADRMMRALIPEHMLGHQRAGFGNIGQAGQAGRVLLASPASLGLLLAFPSEGPAGELGQLVALDTGVCGQHIDCSLQGPAGGFDGDRLLLRFMLTSGRPPSLLYFTVPMDQAGVNLGLPGRSWPIAGTMKTL